MSKEKQHLLQLLAMSSVFNQPSLDRATCNVNYTKTSTKEDIAKRNGLQEFKIGGKSYWAINYKNAIRKFNKDKTKTK